MGIYSFDKNSSAKTFKIDTPPPTVSGALHMGHVFSYVHADFVARYKRISGLNVFYPIGFDNNGLPTERLVQKVFDIRVGATYKSKSLSKLVNEIGFTTESEKCEQGDFIEICKLYSAKIEDTFKNLFDTLSMSFDWDLKYTTASDNTKKVIKQSFLDLYKKGLIYRKKSPVYWDTEDKTALAQADIEDREVQSAQHIIKFTVKESGEEILVMTTRPEMLPACLCVLYHPSDKRFDHLKGKSAIVPHFGHEVSFIADEDVDPEKGTGVVMCCSYGDMTDANWVKKFGLTPRQIISDDGKIIHDFALSEGKYLKVVQAREKVIEELDKGGFLLESTPITHAVKVGERSGKPVEVLLKDQWYVSVMPFKQDLLEHISFLKFLPPAMHIRLKQWTEGLNQDWCISRNRFFGIEVPVGHLHQLFEGEYREVSGIDFLQGDLENLNYFEDHEKTLISDAVDGYDDGIYKVERSNFVLDTWFTSSSTRFLSDFIHKESKELFDIRPQAHEIIRTWTFYTVVKNFLQNIEVREKIDPEDIRKACKKGHYPSVRDSFEIRHIELPWKSVFLSGWCLAEDKTKMSKSKGNAADPLQVLQKYGADSVRLWASGVSLGSDTAFSSTLIDTRFVTKLANCAKFVSLNLPVNHELSGPSHPLDVSFLGELSKVVKEFRKEFENLDYFTARKVLDRFFWDEFCNNYIEIVKVRYYGLDAHKYKGLELSGEQKTKVLMDQKSAINALIYAMSAICICYGVYCPEVAQKSFEGVARFFDIDSVHQVGSLDAIKNFDGSGGVYNAFCSSLSEVRKLKTSQNLSMNAPLESGKLEGEFGSNIIDDVVEDFKNVTQIENVILQS